MGILQSEADHIDEYLCPRCAPNSQLNVPNQKRLTADDYEAIKKLVKQLWVSFTYFLLNVKSLRLSSENLRRKLLYTQFLRKTKDFFFRFLP